jgi:sugar lactone lactonase YvrE
MSRWGVLCVFAGFSGGAAIGQYTIRTIAGGGTPEGAQATTIGFNPYGVAVDRAGNIYLADIARSQVLKISPGGIVSRFAGNGYRGFGGDGGPATGASLANPFDLKVDEADNVYIADSGNYRIRKVSRDGIIITVAGNGFHGYGGDGGPATKAVISDVQGLAIDKTGNLFLADQGNYRVPQGVSRLDHHDRGGHR